MPPTSPRVTAGLIQQAHQLYSQLTGQSLSLRFDRERLWYEFLHAGFTLEDLAQVIGYLQKEIRHARRNVGALKLSNLLQPDRFEEDLNISRVRLAPASVWRPDLRPVSTLSPTQQERGRQRALDQLRQLKDRLRQGQI
jgi:hypothetical protein